jgi:hypothetical protein
MPRYWIVICPVDRMRSVNTRVRDLLWDRWYSEKCVAIGFSPPECTLDGPAPREGWSRARKQLKKIRVGDRVIPFPQNFRIGPVGKVTDIKVSDEEWDPTLKAEEAKSGKAGFGRRITVEWEKDGMPLNGRLATVPKDLRRPPAVLARSTINELTPKRFQELRGILANPANWTNV